MKSSRIDDYFKKGYSNTVYDNPKYSRNLYNDVKKRTKLELYLAILLCFLVVSAVVLLILKKYFQQFEIVDIFFVFVSVLTVFFSVYTIIISIKDSNKGMHSSYIKLALSFAFMAIPVIAVLGINFCLL